MKKKQPEKIDRFAKLYTGFRFMPRPGSMDFMKYPTRIGNSLFYMDSYGTYTKSTKDSANNSSKRVDKRIGDSGDNRDSGEPRQNGVENEGVL
jgi:hypothetical protein